MEALYDKFGYLVKNDINRCCEIVDNLLSEDINSAKYQEFRKMFNIVKCSDSGKFLDRFDDIHKHWYDKNTNLLREDMKSW